MYQLKIVPVNPTWWRFNFSFKQIKCTLFLHFLYRNKTDVFKPTLVVLLSLIVFLPLQFVHNFKYLNCESNHDQSVSLHPHVFTYLVCVVYRYLCYRYKYRERSFICFTLCLDNAPEHHAHSQLCFLHHPLVAVPLKSGLLRQEDPIPHCSAPRGFHINCGEHNR